MGIRNYRGHRGYPGHDIPDRTMSRADRERMHREAGMSRADRERMHREADMSRADYERRHREASMARRGGENAYSMVLHHYINTGAKTCWPRNSRAPQGGITLGRGTIILRRALFRQSLTLTCVMAMVISHGILVRARHTRKDFVRLDPRHRDILTLTW